MSFQDQYIFWHLTNYFLTSENYRLIHLHEESQELWLDNPTKKTRPIIRMQMKELSWANAANRDVFQTLRIADNIRKQLGKPKISLFNVYITPFPPHGDTGELFHTQVQSKNKKVTAENILITQENTDQQLTDFAEKLGIPKEQLAIPETITEEMVEEARTQVINYITMRVQEEQHQARKEKPYVTYTFIGLLVLMFLVLTFTGGSTNSFNLIKWGGKFNPLIYAGEWWRLITPMFLHNGWMHIAANAVMLYIVGPWAEKIYGKWRFALILLIGGFAGNLASFVLNNHLSVGASTSVFAVFGALLYLVVLKPNLYAKTIGTNVATLVVVNILIGLFSAEIDMMGHIGGLVGGFLIAGSISLPNQYFNWKRALYSLSSLVLIGLFLYAGYQNGTKPYDPALSNAVIQDDLNNGEYKKADRLINTLISSNSADEYTYVFAGAIAQHEKNSESLGIYAKKSIELNPEMPNSHYLLSLHYLETGNRKAALREAKRANQLADNDIYKSYYESLKNTEK